MTTCTRRQTAYDLVGPDNQPVRKFPCKSPLGTLTILRFTEPTVREPKGLVVAIGYPPFAPEKIGMTLMARG